MPHEVTVVDVETIDMLQDRVLLRLSPRVKREGLIVLPDKVELSVWHSGTVVKTGPGMVDSKGRLKPCSVRPGQKAVFKAFQKGWEKWEGVDGGDYIVVREPDIEFCMEERG